MLRDLYVAAWIKSAEPVPDWHDQHPNTATAATSATAQGCEKGANAAKPFTGKIYHAGGGVSNPELIYEPKPEPSEEARESGGPLVVVVGCVVDTDGLPRNVHMIRGFNAAVDKKALAAVPQYRFKPGTYHGKPVPVAIDIEVALRPN